MPLLGKLVPNALLVVLAGSAIAAYAAVSIFPLTPEQSRTLWTALAAAVAAECAVVAAALALADALTPEERALELVYPRVERIREISADIAHRVVRTAQKDGVDGHTDLRKMNDEELMQFVKSRMWNPQI